MNRIPIDLPDEMSLEEYLRYRERGGNKGGTTNGNRDHKYNAQRIKTDTVTFDSKAEWSQWETVLKPLEAAGMIWDLELQPRFMLQEGFTDTNGDVYRAIEYIADFRFKRRNMYGEIEDVVQDVKGQVLSDFKLKWRLFRRLYPDLIGELVMKDGVHTSYYKRKSKKEGTKK